MGRIPADQSVFHAIADPTRRAILDLLRDGEMTVTALMDGVSPRGKAPGTIPSRTRRRPGAARSHKRPPRMPAISQSAFSQHLAVLRRAGLVAARKSGRQRVYAFTPTPLREVMDWITTYDRFWTDRLDRLGRYLDAHAGQPRPATPGTHPEQRT